LLKPRAPAPVQSVLREKSRRRLLNTAVTTLIASESGFPFAHRRESPRPGFAAEGQSAMRPSIDQVLHCIGAADKFTPIRYLDEPPRRIARRLWRRAARYQQADRIIIKTACVRLLSLKGGAR